MANEQDRNPRTGQESDVGKAQAAQQPTGQQGQQRETAEKGAEMSGDQAATGQSQTGSSPDQRPQGDTLAQQRADVEGAGLSGTDRGQAGGTGGQAGGGFVGSQGEQDSSSELIDEEDEDFARGGQGAPEGK